MEQTPIHEYHNPDLLRIIPRKSKKLIEIGCSSGALAREWKQNTAVSHYLGVEIDERYTTQARRYCDQCITFNIENANTIFYSQQADRDCWIFGDILEHLRDPWAILSQIRKIIPSNGTVVACIPNSQHWSLQLRLCTGDFRYENSGLLDKTHIRFFTRITIIELFESTGFKIVEGFPRIFNEPAKDKYLPLIENFAKIAGFDPAVAVSDSLPLQYVVRAIPS
ncbi:MAG: class I SAM-dependent methyltransferase [Candidatus Methylumidiphilus sp.]